MTQKQALKERIRSTKEALAEATNTQGHLKRQLKVLRAQLKPAQPTK